MGRRKSSTCGMSVQEKANTPLARRLSEIITDTGVLLEHLGVSAQTVSQWKLGETRPSIENLCEIAKFYDVTTDWLLGLTDVRSVETSVRSICEQTGLAEGVVDWLQSLDMEESIKPYVLSGLNAMLSYPEIEDMCFHIWAMLQNVRKYGKKSGPLVGTEESQRMYRAAIDADRRLKAATGGEWAVIGIDSYVRYYQLDVEHEFSTMLEDLVRAARKEAAENGIGNGDDNEGR